MTIREANAMRLAIGRAMIESVNDARRYPRGTVQFAETDLVARTLGSVVRRQGHPDNVPVREIAGLDERVREKIARSAPRVSRGRLLQMSVQEQRDRFGLSTEEVSSLRRALIGLEGPEAPPEHRWDPRPHRRAPSSPTAKSAEASGSQGPSTTPRERRTVPDVIGQSLTDALVAFRESGLHTEPTIRYVQSSQYEQNRVVASQPGAGAPLGPDTAVELHVSRGAA